MKQLIILLITTLLLLSTATAEIATETEGTSDSTLQLTLKDVYMGSSKQESGCIFDVNGITAVVDYHDTQTVNGVTIYVQDVYAVNSQAQDKDNCAFLYYLVGTPEQKEASDLEVDESMKVNTATVGDEEVEFLLTSRTEYDELVEEQENKGEYIEVEEETPEQTAVTINGVDVTGTDMPEETIEANKETDTTETSNTNETEESKSFFGWFLSLFFG
jgi:hypothetical protein